MLSKFKPPGEAQQVYRLLFHFAGQYVKHNKERGLTLDTVHFLAYAILMLHTDRHNPKVKRKMNKEQFKKIVAAGGAQIPEDAVECMYDRVVAHEFRLQITESDRVSFRVCVLLMARAVELTSVGDGPFAVSILRRPALSVRSGVQSTGQRSTGASAFAGFFSLRGSCAFGRRS